MIGFGFLGLVIPTTSVMALDHHGEIAGAASALMGTHPDGDRRPRHRAARARRRRQRRAMLAGIAGVAVLTWALAWVSLRGEPAVQAASQA